MPSYTPYDPNTQPTQYKRQLYNMSFNPKQNANMLLQRQMMIQDENRNLSNYLKFSRSKFDQNIADFAAKKKQAELDKSLGAGLPDISDQLVPDNINPVDGTYNVVINGQQVVIPPAAAAVQLKQKRDAQIAAQKQANTQLGLDMRGQSIANQAQNAEANRGQRQAIFDASQKSKTEQFDYQKAKDASEAEFKAKKLAADQEYRQKLLDLREIEIDAKNVSSRDVSVTDKLKEMARIDAVLAKDIYNIGSNPPADVKARLDALMAIRKKLADDVMEFENKSRTPAIMQAPNATPTQGQEAPSAPVKSKYRVIKVEKK